MQQARSAQAGFSLVELLVAVVILAVGLLGLAELQITATKANAQSDSILAASSLAQEVIEEIAAKDANDPLFDAAVVDEFWDANDNGVNDDSVSLEGAGTYDVTYSVVQNYQGVTDLCRITVKVTSQQAVMNVLGNRTRTVTATTIKRTI